MHGKSSTHQTALLTMQTFLCVKENKLLSVHRIHNKLPSDTITSAILLSNAPIKIPKQKQILNSAYPPFLMPYFL